MILRRVIGSIALLVLLGSFTSAKEITIEKSPQYGVGLKVGVLGLGVDFSHSIGEKLNIRLNINGAAHSNSRYKKHILYDYDLNLATIGLLFDYYPNLGAFHFTAGLYYNANKFDVDAHYGINENIILHQLGTIKGFIEFNRVAPYIGIGWGNAIKKADWGFYADAGIVYHGEPQVELDVVCGIVNDATCLHMNNEVESDRLELVDELSDYKLYPIASFGVTYTF